MEDNFKQKIADLGLTEDVIVTGYVSDEELANLYRHCFAFVYPTWYEGFGLPVLEAMNFNKPVIASNVTSIPEITGDAAILTTPGDVEGLAEGMRRLEEDAALRSELSEKMEQRLDCFSWERAAEKLKTIYCKLVQ